MRMTSWMVLGLMLAAPAYAGQVYKWVDPDGRVHYGDQPMPGAKAVDLRTNRGTLATTDPVAETSAAEDDAEPKPAEKLKPDPELCAQKKKELETYNTASKIVERDRLGRDKEYGEEEKKMLIERTQKQIEQACAQ